VPDTVRRCVCRYPTLLENATNFCSQRGLPLVIKIHPHLVGKERREQERLIQKLKQRYSQVFASSSSINFLTDHALFTMTLNGGTLMDVTSARFEPCYPSSHAFD
jgi:hypothetical protein